MSHSFTHLSFDCYGTLVDWEQGICQALEPLLAAHGAIIGREAILRSYVRHEAEIEAQGWRPYREVLDATLTAIAQEFQITLKAHEHHLVSASLPTWPPFRDTKDALKRLAARFRLMVLSNTDDSLFAETQKVLGIRFDEVITSEQLKSYKPAPNHFLEAVRRSEVPASRILHVAQSLYHDHVPARQLGFQTAWIKRSSLLQDTGLAPAADAQPDMTFTDLAGLASCLLEG